MKNETHDQIAYRIAVAAIGAALIVALAGLCVIVAIGEGDEIPKELWSTVSALGGGLLGLLAPAPTPSAAKDEKKDEDKGKEGGEKPVTPRPALLEAARMNRSVVILLAVFVFSILVAMIGDSTQFQALAAASGAALIGLLAPSPAAERD
jgi:hypothetical protein